MSAPYAQGDLIAGKYVVDRVIGEGGMGVVVSAKHLSLDQRVAIKFLLPAAKEHPEVVERFQREARAAAQIQGEHVARVIDVATLDDGTPYMVMEFLEGEDLSSLLEKNEKTGAKIPVEDAVKYILQACEALAEAHSAGIVHRDLKPSNLFLTKRKDRRPIIKVLDFGISKMTQDSASAHLTGTAVVMGTPYYMSPEQMMSSKNVDSRTDIWALGAVLYELLIGVPPFQGEAMPEIVAKVLAASPAPPSQIRMDIPESLNHVILRCLEKDISKRFSGVNELAQALVPFVSARDQGSIDRISHVMMGASFPPNQLSSSASNPLIIASKSTLGNITNTSFGASGSSSAISVPIQKKKIPFILGAALLATSALIATLLGFWLSKKSTSQFASSKEQITSQNTAAPSPNPSQNLNAPQDPYPVQSASNPQTVQNTPPVFDDHLNKKKTLDADTTLNKKTTAQITTTSSAPPKPADPPQDKPKPAATSENPYNMGVK